MAALSQPTLERLLRDTRIFLNQPNAANSRWTDSELTEYLNDGIKTYFLHLNEMAEGQFDKSVSLDIVASVETVDLPTDCFTVKVLYKKQNSTYKPLVYRNNFMESFDTNPSVTIGSYYEPTYYFRGNKLVLHPIPGTSEVAGLLLEYTAFPEAMLIGSDVMAAGINPVFKELVVMYAVHKAKVRDDLVSGSNTRQAAADLLNGLYITFKAAVAERSKYPQFIVPFTP